MPSRSGYIVGPLILDSETRVLLHGRKLVPLGERAVSVLISLIRNAGQVVTKERLVAEVWKGQIVEEGNLPVQISHLRRALGEFSAGQEWISTVARRGYRFEGPVVALQAVTAGEHRPKSADAPGTSDAPKLLILPFEEVGVIPGSIGVGDDIAAEVTAFLSTSNSFSLVTKNLSVVYRNRPIDLTKIRSELNVRYVLDGSIRVRHRRIEVTAELTHADLGVVVWVERFVDELERPRQLVDRVAAAISAAIPPRLLFAEVNRARRIAEVELQGYDLFLRATGHFYAMTRQDLDAATSLLLRAIDRDPTYARSYALLGRCYLHRKVRGWVSPGDPSIEEGARCAWAAVDRGGSDPEVLWMAAIGIGLAGGEIASSVSLIDRSLQLQPSSADALAYSGMLRAYLGDAETSLAHIARSINLSCIDAQTYNKHTAAAFAHFMADRPEAAWEASERALLFKHNYEPPLRMRAACLGLLGRLPEARAAVARLQQTSPHESLTSIRSYYQTPFKLEGACNRLIKGLAQAGLPMVVN